MEYHEMLERFAGIAQAAGWDAPAQVAALLAMAHTFDDGGDQAPFSAEYFLDCMGDMAAVDPATPEAPATPSEGARTWPAMPSQSTKR